MINLCEINASRAPVWPSMTSLLVNGCVVFLLLEVRNFVSLLGIV